MKPHPRIRKTIKWGGAAVTVLLVVVWIGSGWERVGRLFLSGHVVMISHGGMYIRFSPQNAGRPAEWHSERNEMPFKWWGHWQHTGPRWELRLPIWLLIAPAALGTGAAWRLDTLTRRRARLGLCSKCHYDRAGLAKDAVCPECGAAAPTAV